MAVLRRIINRIRSQREEGEVQATNVARYDLDVVEVQSSIIADLAEVNRLLLEELENYRSMEDEDKQLLMMIEDIKEGREDLERMGLACRKIPDYYPVYYGRKIRRTVRRSIREV